MSVLVTFNVPGNALVALAAAAAWGGGDFAGGMGVKAAGGGTRGALRIVAMAHALSLFVLLGILFVQRAAIPHGAPLAWGLGAGVAAGLSLTAFYIALARGAMGASAAISGLLAAAIPVAVSVAMEGAPALLQAAGFLLAGVAIWIIAAAPTSHDPIGAVGRRDAKMTMGLAIFAGIGFGVYFVSLRQANSLGVFVPMTLARIASLATCLVLLLLLRREPNSEERTGFRAFLLMLWRCSKAVGVVFLGRKRLQQPRPLIHLQEKGFSRSVLLWTLGVAVLDTGGNLLFIVASRMGRLDVAAVLASLYPASTILLAAWQLHERPTGRQVAGMVLALAAVVMITV